jgi:MFS family permease
MTAEVEGKRLTRNADFVKLWTGQTVSAFGTMFGALGLTALVYLHARPSQMGLLAAAEGIPVLLFTLFAGVWVDRLRRRPIMIGADVGRALLLATVPAAAAFGELRIEQLYVVAFFTGILSLSFDLSYRSYLPSVVEPGQILLANGRLQASESIAEVGSPAAGAAIVQVAGGPVAVLVDALTFAVSAVSVALIRRPEARREPSRQRASMLVDVVEGLRAVWRDHILRALLLTGGISRFFGGFYGGLYALFLIRTLGLSPLAMGITIGVGGIGSLGGALLTGAMTKRLGFGGAVLASKFATTVLSLPLVLATGGPEVAFAMIVGAQLLGDPNWASYEITTTTLRQTATPQRLLGRVNSTTHLVQAGLQPCGAVVAGVLAEAIGVREALFVAFGAGSLSLVPLLLSPIPKLRDAPLPTEGA